MVTWINAHSRVKTPLWAFILQDRPPLKATDQRWRHTEILTRQTLWYLWLLPQTENVRRQAPGPTHGYRTATFLSANMWPVSCRGSTEQWMQHWNGGQEACLGSASRQQFDLDNYFTPLGLWGLDRMISKVPSSSFPQWGEWVRYLEIFTVTAPNGDRGHGWHWRPLPTSLLHQFETGI